MNKINWDSPSIRSYFHENAERYGNDRHCVYLWEDDSCDVFYVGRGVGYRFSDVNPKTRSAEFLKWYKNCRNPHPHIVAYGMTMEEAIAFEKRLILAFWELGFPLVNVAGIPEREKKVWTDRGKKISKTMLEKCCRA